MHEVDPRLRSDLGEKRIGAVFDVERVPLHLRSLDIVGESPDHSFEDAKSVDLRRLFGSFVEHLHPDADTEEWATHPDRFADRALQAARAQPLHACTEISDPRQNNSVSRHGDIRVAYEARVRTHVQKGLFGRTEVSDAVVEDCYQSVPLVDGTLPPSMRTDSRSTLATALNVASMMWCVLRPETIRI